MAVLSPVPDSGAGSQAGSKGVAAPGPLSIAQVAYQAGFRTMQSLTTAIAVALAESGGHPDSLNDTPRTGDYSVGLWQINYYGDMLEPRSMRYGNPNQLRGTDPTGPQALANAKAAYDISGGGVHWSPWTTYTNGAYRQYIPQAQLAAAAVLGQAPGTFGDTSQPLYTSVAGGTGTAGQADAPTNNCVLSLPSLGPIGGGCILHESNVRAILGGLLMAAGVLVAGLGVTLLVAKDTQALPGALGVAGGLMRKADNKVRPDPGDVAYDRYQKDRTEGTNRHNLGTVVPASELTGDAF